METGSEKKKHKKKKKGKWVGARRTLLKCDRLGQDNSQRMLEILNANLYYGDGQTVAYQCEQL